MRRSYYSHAQVMIMIVLVMTGILGFALMQGTIFLNALRQARLAADSVKAFYAADSGVELAQYRYFQDSQTMQVEMTNGTYCCDLTVEPPPKPGDQVLITSQGASPAALSGQRMVRSIETTGW